jgi:SAM-dependent methyltransferase
MIKNIINFFKILFTYFFNLFFFMRKSEKKIELKPMLFDLKLKEPFDPHYLYHTSWAARKIMQIKPKLHYDFGSDLRFVTIFSSTIKIHYFNLSIPSIKLDNLSFQIADLTNLQDIKSNSLDSVSCMHVIEHVGLGRYGDKVDLQGDLKAFKELKRIVSVDGNLLIVIPLGKPKLVYNAHRIYSYKEIIELMNNFKLVEFSLIQDNAYKEGMTLNADNNLVQENIYACGCFWFTKIGA